RGELLSGSVLSSLEAGLQFGHGGEPWRTAVQRRRRRLAVRRFNSATAVSRGEPDRVGMSVAEAVALQFGHGGEPWRTWLPASGGSTRRRLQFGHGGEPWRTILVGTSIVTTGRGSHRERFAPGLRHSGAAAGQASYK